MFFGNQNTPEVDYGLLDGWRFAMVVGPQADITYSPNVLGTLPSRLGKELQRLGADVGPIALTLYGDGNALVTFVDGTTNHDTAFNDVAIAAIMCTETEETHTVVKTMHMGSNRIFGNVPTGKLLDVLPAYDKQFFDLEEDHRKFWHQIFAA